MVPPITISSAPDPSINDSLIVFSPLPGLDSHFLQAPPDRSSPKSSYAGVLSSAAKATTAATVGDRSSVPYPKSCPLKAVPSPKILFVSRLTPDTSVSDFVNYLNTGFGGITHFKADACRKISKPDSNFSSFKTVIPNKFFNTFLKKSCWPADAIVKEFTPFFSKNERASPFVNSRLNRNQKN